MDGSNLASDQVIAELVGMGFDISKVTEAIKEVGPSLDSAIEFLLNGCHKKSSVASSSSKYSSNSEKVAGKRVLSSSHSFGRMRQSSLLDHLQSAGRPKIQRTTFMSGVSVSEAKILPKHVEVSFTPFHCKEEDNGPDWEHKANMLLHKHFGYSSLKGFQKEALAAWVAHKDCLVLAATGSGKSLCFQIPALLTGKVVVVISPLISLMHDQCLKLAKHGISACFLGSGQIDSSVEQKAMNGMYAIIYVCPETVLRLMAPLQGLAESRGIALFAIDEVHCVSKWGHDFRPDYRCLSVLRENFKADNLKFLKFDIPVMALTATATIQVREDILKSLHMSKESKIVLTSFFRPNLRFLVKHSRTSSPSYETDFQELIDVYTRNQVTTKKHKFISQGMKDASDASDNRSSMSFGGTSERDGIFKNNVLDDIEDDYSSESGSHLLASQGEKLSVEYLEDECDLLQDVDDFDVSCGEFYGQTPRNDWNACASSEAIDMASTPEERIELMKGPLEHGSEAIDMASTPEERIELMKGPLEHGSTIIYVCTRKETLNIAKFLCRCGVKAAAYNAKLPKSHLRQVHKEFHENTVEVVVATIAFGMGIDKSNVRRIYHYGWPQSLEAYYQEAGRAGRDGKLADCVLYANLLRKPSLLPSKRSEEQTKQAYRMLSDCFRYGIHTSICRAKALVQYFGEDFSREKCLVCDVCVEGPPEMQNLMDEAQTFVRVIAAHHGQSSFLEGSYDDNSYHGNRRDRVPQKPNIKMFVSKIREQLQKFTTTDHLWWQGLARILEDKGFIREGDDRIHVQIKFPEPTKRGLEFLQTNSEEPFYVYPEADMLLSMSTQKPYSSFAEWGKGWADPEIRKQRLERKKQSWRSPRKRKSRKRQLDLKTVRGRLAAKLSK